VNCRLSDQSDDFPALHGICHQDTGDTAKVNLQDRRYVTYTASCRFTWATTLDRGSILTKVGGFAVTLITMEFEHDQADLRPTKQRRLIPMIPMRRASDFLAAFGATRSPSSSSRMKREAAVEPSPPLSTRRNSGSDSDSVTPVDSLNSAQDSPNGFKHESSEDELSGGDTIHGKRWQSVCHRSLHR
jgi:hypothetical protein